MNNLNGILMVIASMAFFTMEDMFIKSLTASISVGQVLILLGIGSGAVFAVIAKVQGHALFAPAAWRGKPLMRAGTEMISAMGFASALSLVDLSTVAAVFQATPLVITMGAALFLNEQVGWRRWAAIVVGFLGVLLIIRPGLEGFDPSALLVLVAVLGVAARDLLTRVMDSAVPSSVVSFQAFVALILAGGILMGFAGQAPLPLTSTEGGMMVGGILFGVMGYYAIVTATRIGDASAITPFRYTRLLFSILVGMVVFGERPDLLTMTGASLIIMSGLYTFLRERRLLRRARREAARSATAAA